MVCMGWENEFNALNGGAHGGGCSFFIIVNGICEMTAETVGSATEPSLDFPLPAANTTHFHKNEIILKIFHQGCEWVL